MMMRMVTTGVRTGRRDASLSGIKPPIRFSSVCADYPGRSSSATWRAMPRDEALRRAYARGCRAEFVAYLEQTTMARPRSFSAAEGVALQVTLDRRLCRGGRDFAYRQ